MYKRFQAIVKVLFHSTPPQNHLHHGVQVAQEWVQGQEWAATLA